MIPPPAWLTWWLNFWGWLEHEKYSLAGLGALGTTLVAILTLLVAFQAKRQANITRKMFEATYRPWVEAVFDDGCVFHGADNYTFYIHLKNHGQVPAFLLKWQLLIFELGKPPLTLSSAKDWTRPLYPGAARTIMVERSSPVPAFTDYGPIVTVDFLLKYRGSHKSVYSVWFTMKGSAAQWENTGFRAL